MVVVLEQSKIEKLSRILVFTHFIFMREYIFEC